MTRLILINGAPGSGKSTLARMLVDEQPLALLLDIDTLRGQLGQWSDDPVAAGMAARRLALAMIHTHLVAGHDVVVPQFFFASPSSWSWNALQANLTVGSWRLRW